MIPGELLYSLIGLASAFVAHRLGLPLFGPKASAPTDWPSLVRQVLLDVLKGVNQPPTAPDEEIRQHLQAIAGLKKN